MTQVLMSLSSAQETQMEVPVSWLQSGLLAIAGIWRVNQQTEHLCFSTSLLHFLSNKINILKEQE